MFVKDSKTLKQAVMPVLKITCTSEYSYKKIDISIQDSIHNGMACVNLVKSFLDDYETLKPLVLVLKNFIYSSGLYDTYNVLFENSYLGRTFFLCFDTNGCLLFASFS